VDFIVIISVQWKYCNAVILCISFQLCSVTSHWQLEINHGGNIRDTGKHNNEDVSFLPETQLLGIYQHNTGKKPLKYKARLNLIPQGLPLKAHGVEATWFNIPHMHGTGVNPKLRHNPSPTS
jgi:hypothetical protein